MAKRTLQQRELFGAAVAGARWLMNPVSEGGAKQVPRMLWKHRALPVRHQRRTREDPQTPCTDRSAPIAAHEADAQGEGALPVRFPRALSGFVEASDIVKAVSGGVKNNALDPTGKIRARDYDKDVYGNVPYARVEYTARSIVAYFNLDLALIRGFDLPKPATTLLVALSLLKVRRFLAAGLRLRTACDLTASAPFRVKAPIGFDLPDEAALLGTVKQAIQDCREAGLFASPSITLITTTSVAKADAKDTPAV